MTDPEVHPPDFPREGPSRRRSPRRLFLGVAAALVVATGAGIAATGNSPLQQAGTDSAPAHKAQPSPTPGGYQTFTSQTGTVTSVRQGSISIQGRDGNERTYAVSDRTRVSTGPRGMADISTGDTVWVIGSAQDRSPTAFLVVDLNRPRWPGHEMGGTAPPTPTGPTSPGSPEVSPPASPGQESPSPGEVSPTE
jgi:hypothetical protein